MTMRTLARSAAYRSGVFWALHRERLRNSLTVIMLHRVLSTADADYSAADARYTVSIEMFEALIRFMQRHFALVSLQDVLDASQRKRALPSHALMITFDDGWRDNLVYAAPILLKHRVPAVVFGAVEPIASGAQAWWQEQVFRALREGKLADAISQAGANPAFPASELLLSLGDEMKLIFKLAALPESQHNALISQLPGGNAAERMMLAPSELARLKEFGIAVGAHGYTHLPLDRVINLPLELANAHRGIKTLSGDEAGSRVLAYPHGRYDERVVSTAKSSGFDLQFSSEAKINRVRDGFIDASRPLGRINMEQPHLVDASGRPDESAMASWLWPRAVR